MATTMNMEKAPVSETTIEPTEEEIEQQKQEDRLSDLLKEHGVS